LTASSTRRHDIDWLRVLAMLAVFIFHNARFFDFHDWHVKNGQLSLGFSMLVSFLVFWIMPIFFVLSGVSARYAMRKRTAGAFVWSRVKRLLVPLVFGIFVLIPPQVYIERVSHSQFAGSFIDFYPHYFDGFYAFGGNFAWMGLHLWYLMLLFILSMLLLPLLRAMARSESGGFLTRLAGVLTKPGAIFGLAVPLAAVQLLVDLQPGGVGMRVLGGWSPFVYLVFFLLGRLVASDDRYRQAIIRQRWSALIIALAVTALLMTASYLPGFVEWFGPMTRYLPGGILRTLASWCWIVALMGMASAYLTFSNRFLRYTNEAVLPFYILHQSVIVVVGFYLIDWSAGAFAKYLVLAAVSFVVIGLLYEILIRRVGPLRLLFGLRIRSQ
jgi:peptidoglycan/LPS O-acetylase OafA/YrhL